MLWTTTRAYDNHRGRDSAQKNAPNVTNEASNRIYPVPGAEVVPVTYSAVGSTYAMIVVPFGIFALMLLVLASLAHDAVTLAFAAPFILVILLGIVGARRLRLEIRPEGISYTGWVGAPRFIAFCEISAAVIGYRGRDRRTGGPRRIVLAITPSASTGKRPLKLQLRAFPPGAHDGITKLLDPEISYGRF
jgi:hypothetical protein